VIIVVFKLPNETKQLILPHWLLMLHQKILGEFNHPQNANFLFSMLTGEKKGLSSTLLRDLDILKLRFLLSPSGLHLTGLLFFIKKRKNIFPLYFLCWLLPNFYSLKRIALLRILSFSKKKISPINTLYITFIISFCCGHFFKSPRIYL
jgi:hypothetical protein